MSFTYTQRVASSRSGSYTTVPVTLTGVAAGSLIVVTVRHEGETTGMSCSDGTSTLSEGNAIAHSFNDLESQMFYLLSSVATGSVTYTVTLDAVRSYLSIVAEEYTYTGGAVSLDTQAAGAYGTGTAIATDSFTTTGTDELVVAGTVVYETAQNFSAPLINGVGIDQYGYFTTDSAPIGMQSADFTSTFTGASSGTLSSSGIWVTNALAFKITAGGASFIAQPPNMVNQAINRASTY